MVIKTYTFEADQELLVREGQAVPEGAALASGDFVNNIFYIDMSRLLLVALFLFICFLVLKATNRRIKQGRE